MYLLLILTHDFLDFARAIEGDTQVSLSPEQMRYLGEKEYNGSYSRQKSEVFSYGMLLLEMATFCRASAFYNFFSYVIDFKQLNLAITSLRSRYSSGLVDFIKSLLSENPSSRPNFSQIE